MALSANDLEKLRAGIQNRCRVKVRGIDFVFRPLTINEISEATTEALSAFERLLPIQRHEIGESSIMAICILTRASKLKDDPVGVTEDTLRLLSPDELGYLFREYQQLMASCNPILEELPAEEMKALAEEIKKNPSSRLIACSSLELVNLVRSLLRQIP